MNSIEEFETKLSIWSYTYCRDVEDDPIVRQYITHSFWAYIYCEIIKDRIEVRRNITKPCWAFDYCISVKYREELAEIARQGGYDI